MAALDQVGANLTIVVNLTIQDYGHRAVFVEQRLMATLDVDDAESSHAQCNLRSQKISILYRATVVHDFSHVADDKLIDTSDGRIDSGDSTHGLKSTLLSEGQATQ